MSISIQKEGSFRFPYSGLKKGDIAEMAERICELLETGNAIITIILTDNAYIRTINKKYRKKDRPTDVISFAYRENPFPAGDSSTEELGDVYLSLEQAALQSRELGVTMRDETARLLVHGILHLLGYDHETSARDAVRMRKKEDEILGKL